MAEIHNILKQYWGYDQFRPMQEEIIQAVLNGDDTLALLPTGGGKSICFQVPGLALGGLCLVVSPLIALMNDQVSQLERRDIRATAITSMLRRADVDRILEQCLRGDFQFLYVSPERLATEQFRSYLPNLNITLMAIDEAHCISQWGYDFRPSYLKIAEVRPLLNKSKNIALTATATPEVCQDLIDKLNYKNAKVFRKSFMRENLIYGVRYCSNKLEKLEQILNNIPGTAVVYARNRKKTEEIAKRLEKDNTSASFYHAGLDAITRKLRQQWWIENKIRTIVCTNAFGMGIDKPDVRSVVHLDLPDSPEAYFQEAGRAGRDEKRAYAVLLVDDADLLELEARVDTQFPPFDRIKAIYNFVCNYLQLPVNAGKEQIYEFHLLDFCKKFKINPLECHHALKFIEQEGLFSYIENPASQHRFMFLENQYNVYDFELKNPSFEPLIKAILRSYSGIFNDLVAIQPKEIGDKVNLDAAKVQQMLAYMNKLGLAQYYPAVEKPQLFFNLERQHPDHVPISKQRYEDRKIAFTKRVRAMLAYVSDNQTCRSVKLVAYFGEHNAKDCGKCDVCADKLAHLAIDEKMNMIMEQILALLSEKPMTIKQLQAIVKKNINLLFPALRKLIDNQKIKENNKNEYYVT